MNIINNHQAQTERIEGISVIVDVREFKEYQDNHIPGAINIPSTKYKKHDYLPFQGLKICLVCMSGNRSKQIHDKLTHDGFERVEVLEFQMQDIQTLEKNKGWTVDRQFRIVLGILLAVYLMFQYIGFEYGIIIPVILSAGLIITSIIDRCYMKMGIALLPWNTEKKASK